MNALMNDSLEGWWNEYWDESNKALDALNEACKTKFWQFKKREKLLAEYQKHQIIADDALESYYLLGHIMYPNVF